MTIQDMVDLLQAKVLCGEDKLETPVFSAFCSDLMSDVLTLRTEKMVMLMTGLANMQTIRTCEMSDIKVVVFVRGKKVTDEMKELAADNEMVLIETNYSAYRSSGILFGAGLPGVY